MKPFIHIAGIFVLCMAVLGSTQYCHSQVYPYPYQSEVFLQHSARTLIDQGMIRRAASRLASSPRKLDHSVIRNMRVFNRADVLRHSQIRPSAQRELGEFVNSGSNTPHNAHAWAERAFIALEDSDAPLAIDFFGRSSTEALKALRERQDTAYRSLAHMALFWEGASRARLGQYQEAVATFSSCVKADSSGIYSGWAVFSTGQLHELNGNSELAIVQYSHVRKFYPNSTVVIAARIREAMVYLTLRQPERALDVLADVPRLIALSNLKDSSLQDQLYFDHVNEDLLLVQAEALTLRGLHKDALDSCQSFISRYPSSPYIWHVRLHAAYAALSVGKNDYALENSNSIVEGLADEGSIVRQQALLYRALALKKLGRDAESRSAFRDLSVMNGYMFQAQALVEIGQDAYENGEYDKARKAIERAERESRDASTTVRAQIILGAVLLETQQWAKAAQTYERALDLALDAPERYVPGKITLLSEIRLKRGIALIQAGQTRQAIGALTEFLGSHPTDPRRDEATFWLAESMYRGDLLKNAQELYEEVVNRFTSSSRREEALYGLSWTYFRRRNFDRSSRSFGELLQLYPKSRYATEALARRGDAYYISKQFQAAAEQYSEAAIKGPATEDGQYAAYQSGQAWYRAGNNDRARESMRKFVLRYPHSRLADDAMYLIGYISFQEKNDDQAIEEFNKLLSAYPEGDQAVRALYTIADSRYNLGDVEGALAGYRTVIGRYPSHPLATESAKNMQISLLSMGRSQEAIAIADEFIAANPQSLAAEEFSLKKAEIFYSGKNYSNAAQELQAYMKSFPSSVRQDEVLYMLGRTYLSMNDIGQARSAFFELEKKHIGSAFIPSSKIDLAEYFTTKADASSADSVYRVVWEKFPNDSSLASRAGYERATLARLRQDTIGAIELFRSTADRYPRSEYGDQARYQATVLYRRQGTIDSARFHLEVLARRTERPAIASNALYDLGTSYMREKRYDQAIIHFENVRTEFAGFEDFYTLSLLSLGECYESVNRIADARTVYELLVRLRPDDDYGKTAASRIKRLKKGRQ